MSVFSQSIASQYTGATTITLMPQTVNGTVLSATPSGGFTDYTVSLAPDNLFFNVGCSTWSDHTPE
jgi:hypothetical protein